MRVFIFIFLFSLSAFMTWADTEISIDENTEQTISTDDTYILKGTKSKQLPCMIIKQ